MDALKNFFAENEFLRLEAVRLAEENKGLSKTTGDLKAECESLLKEAADTKSKNAVLKSDLCEAQETLRKSRKECSSQEKELSEEREKKVTLLKQNRHLQSRLATLESDLRILKNTKDHAETRAINMAKDLYTKTEELAVGDVKLQRIADMLDQLNGNYLRGNSVRDQIRSLRDEVRPRGRSPSRKAVSRRRSPIRSRSRKRSPSLRSRAESVATPGAPLCDNSKEEGEVL
jgi:chromosome segregation ATPase